MSVYWKGFLRVDLMAVVWGGETVDAMADVKVDVMVDVWADSKDY